jgi:hypothetical protein
MGKYNPTDLKLEEIGRNFSYHTPKEDQPGRYVEIRDTAKTLAYEIVANTPYSREQSLALTKLEECVMWANAAIARNE